MSNKKKITSVSPIQQIVSYAIPKSDKCILFLPISETENIEIEVRQLLSTDEMVSFVNGVCNAVFWNDEYVPSIYELVISKAILTYYTNLAVFQTNKEASVSLISNEHLTQLVYCTNIIQEVKSKINLRQFESMIVAIDKAIEFKKQEIYNTQSARLEEAIKQIEILINTTERITAQFEGIDMKQATEAAIKIANIPEQELVKNILEVQFNEKNNKPSIAEVSNESER